MGRLLWRVVVLLGTCLGVAFWTSHALIAHAVARGTPEYDVRLAGEMGGLFAGGCAALVVGIGMLLLRRRPPEERQDEP